MACFHPLQAWQLEGGEIVFAERGRVRRALMLPCGRCIGCRLVKSRAWAIRCMHENQMHPVSSFVTLTYQGEIDPSLRYIDFQRFMYRLRKRLGPTRFFMCGEYGDQGLRPHFHALLFGRTFANAEPCGDRIFRSPVLESLWPHGFSSFGSVTYDSASYCARYTTKKISGPAAEAHYTRLDYRTGELVRVVPEFGHMSLKPGIGYSWFQKYWKEVYLARDGVVRKGGQVVPPPRFYDEKLKELAAADASAADCVNRVEFDRYVRAGKFVDDTSPARLAVREQCALAKERFLKRGKL